MASPAIRRLSYITLLCSVLGGVLSGYEKTIDKKLCFTDWEEQITEQEGYVLYKDQKDKIEKAMASQFKKGHIEGIKKLEDGLLYLLSNVEEVPLGGQDYVKVKVYYTLPYPNEAYLASEKSFNQDIVLNKLNHLYMDHRVPLAYIEAITQEEKAQIESLLQVIFSKNKSFLQAYEANWLDSFSTWEKFLNEAPALREKLSIKEESYKVNYGQSLNYIWGQERLIPDWDNISYEVTAHTTKNNHFFNVKIPVEVLREGENRLYYNYHYLVGISEKNIINFKFLKRDLLKEKTF